LETEEAKEGGREGGREGVCVSVWFSIFSVVRVSKEVVMCRGNGAEEDEAKEEKERDRVFLL